MEGGERRIPVQYAKRVVGRKVYGGQNTNLPIKLNMSGVMPIIFANSIVALPSTLQLIFNPRTEATTVELPEGKWSICVNKTTAGTEALAIVEGAVEVDATSAMILVAADPDAELTQPETEVEEPVEKLGFFASIWKAIVDFFGNLFGKKN